MAIQGDEIAKHSPLMQQMFKLRKKVFFDELEWDVPVHGELEFDKYDELDPVYLLWTNNTGSVLYASTRLMPTTGPTLLFDTFRRTFPNEAGLVAPDIWEATRACINSDRIYGDLSSITPALAFKYLMLATCECALAFGIETIVANYEPRMRAIYRRSGAIFEHIGEASGYGRNVVCCGTLSINEELRDNMRRSAGVSGPIFQHSATPLLMPEGNIKTAA